MEQIGPQTNIASVKIMEIKTHNGVVLDLYPLKPLQRHNFIKL